MKRLLFLLVTMTACIAAWAAEPYVVYTPSNTTLTFYYGTKPDGAYSLNNAYYRPEWYHDGTYASVTRVVFDSSFAQARPTATSYWFNHMENLESMLGLNYLNTSQVTDMMYMFCGCKKLTNLNLSGFNTSNVNRMVQMFYGCESLAILNLSSFNTSNVIDMSDMFGHCENLTSLDLSSFNTSKTTSMEGMFSNCKSLSNLKISSFNTSNVVNMRSMFSYCENLTFLDLSSFNTSGVYFMVRMFYDCSNLTTISVGDNWSTQATSAGNSVEMFMGCTKLVGGAGTTYNPNHVNMAYAHIDGGPSNPGYFIGAIEEFDLWINGVQVTNANCYNLSNFYGVSGTVTYNPSSKTFTLENARLSCGETSNGACIRSSIDGLTINVKGTSSILVMPSGTNMNGMVLSNTTITGTDTLGVQGRKSGITIVSGKTLTVNNLHCLIARGSYGIYASSPTNTRLVMKGSGTNVIATGGSGAIRNMEELVLEDGLRITEPVGGYFAGGILYDASGNVATRATISGTLGDVNGDGTVTAADITALYDVLLNNDYSHVVNGDQTGDNIITAADVTAVYTILLSN
jgi:surface protein